ncbi:hypothetical protein GCK72_001919 [Caenorhabditis remanei]|uniref:Tyrosine-protein kinase n=1 Tax=Caenorhabditis remanei TaxID=31234 RepID=A0A6A5HS38_CAERE|nr:hypothetical protein GCK72_001919 [Caenorhabditis remanei]KAF1770101.1 hypothetical protein GCK72_001919 [Caenorhabditis remanei]
MARKEADARAPSHEMHTQDDDDSSQRKKENKQMEKPNVVDKKIVSNPEQHDEQKEFQKESATPKRNNLKSPLTPKTPSPNPSPNKRNQNRPSREKNGQERSVDKESGKQFRSKKRPSVEKDCKESSSSPPKTDAAKEMTNSSTYGSSWHEGRHDKKDLKILEEFISKMPNYHGYICREDVTILLRNPGDWLIRLSVKAPKEKENEKKKGAKSVERGVRKTKEKSSSKAFVVSVHCKGKAVSPGKSDHRNLVIKMNDAKFSLDSISWFMKIADLFSYYQKSTTTHKEGEFQLLNPIHLSVWEFHHDDIELLAKKLGEGAFGEVRVGRMTTKDPKRAVGVVDVAVKMLKNASESVTRDQVEELMHEGRVMRRLDHPNVLRSYGVSVLREPLYLMSELCSNGALREYLKENYKTITLADKLNFVIGSARGVEYLHSQKLIHRDLAVRNILLSEDKTPKISDFGLAKLTDRYEMTEHCKIPVRYLAPETLELYVFTPKTDVFSFGCVIWEIYENGQQPHDGKNAQTIRAQVKKREFLKLSPSAPDSLRRYVSEKVFVADPENRCSMTGIVQCVEKVEKSAK